MIDLLETLLEEGLAIVAQARDNVHRAFSFPEADNVIKVAVGMRRSGKTCFFYQTINQLLSKGVSKEQILFINFEDDRLLPMGSKEMGQLIDAFYTLYPENHHRECYLFLDEVQNVEDWHVVVRRFFDSKKVRLYLTGSSAKLLSKEINTRLRGRSLSLEVWPYSFKEFLSAHHIQIDAKPLLGQLSFDALRQHLLNYFSLGGFPAVQAMPVNEWRETLQGYVDTVILRDIVERYKVSNIALLKYLTITLLKNAASIFSVNKFYNDVKSQGFRVGKDTIHHYLDYLEDAFLIFGVPFFSASAREQQNRPKKFYAIDMGLINATTINFNKNYGKLLENLIYIDLRRQGKTVSYYQTENGYEVDFITKSKTGEREILQITWDAGDKKTLEREQRALFAAEKELGISGRIVTAKDYLKER